jgi:molecular chaperone HscB
MGTKPQTESAIPVLPAEDNDLSSCWSCGDMRAAQFCSGCGKLQPPVPADYFSFFGLPRRLDLALGDLEREMLALSRRLHPDLYARASAQEQEWSLEQTSKLNDAYRTLRDPILRTEYLLRIEGLKLEQQSQLATEEARSTGSKKMAVPPDLLEEVFELNLQLEEFRAASKSDSYQRAKTRDAGDSALRQALEASRQAFVGKMEAIMTELKTRWREWDHMLERETAGETVPPEERRRVLAAMLAILHRRKYVDNIGKEIATALNQENL